MNEAGLTRLEQLRSFLEGTTAVAFRPLEKDDERYAHISAVLRRFGYARLRRADKGLVRRYFRRTTGYSRAPLNRLVGRVAAGQPLGKRYRPPASGYARIYPEADVALLAEIDTLHGTLSGPATKHLMQRALNVFGERRYTRLAAISVAHLYNLRGRREYLARRAHWSKTRPMSVAISVRRAPQPDGCPGYVRIDSVHQGDWDGVKGLYHIKPWTA